VVVSIIALLVSMLLPSLSRAREQAKNTLCLNNLHQIGIGCAIYASESRKNTYPDCKTLGGSSFRVAPGRKSPTSTLAEIYGLAAIFEQRKILPGDNDIWMCPLNKRDRDYGNTYWVNIGDNISQRPQCYGQGTAFVWIYDNHVCAPYLSGRERIQDPSRITNEPFIKAYYYHRGKTQRLTNASLSSKRWGVNVLHFDLSSGFFGLADEPFPNGL